jgi:predicted outer membrane repeat protein
MQMRFAAGSSAAAMIGAVALGLGGAQAAQAAPAVTSAVETPVACSAAALSTAITGAVNGETLRLPRFCTYVLTAALPHIKKNITIAGAGVSWNDTIVRAPSAPDFPIFSLSSKAALTIDHLTLRDGDSAVGGGIYDHGSGALTIIDSTFTGNRSEEGGAVLSDEDGPVTVIGSTFTGNTATDGNGGAVHVTGSLTVTGSTFTGNIATDGNGGAVHINGSLTVNGSTFTGNIASGEGGAIFTHTGDIASVGTSRIESNRAASNGGGIDTGGPLTLTYSLLSANESGALGGGIYNDETGSSTVVWTVVILNRATGGGGIYNEGSTVTLTTSLVTKNLVDNCEPLNTIAGCTN